MRKEITVHFVFMVSLFLLISVFRKWFALPFWPFWIGGIVGTILPDVDHLVYVYFLRPHELTSQRAFHKLSNKDIKGVFSLLADTRSERTKLIFHSALFQIIFLILTFLVITSSGSIFGRGLVLAFSLHLLIDQYVDFMEIGNLDLWFKSITNISIDKEKARLYWGGVLIIILIFGFLV